jgi:hypothetical protein
MIEKIELGETRTKMPAGVAVLTALPMACANTTAPAADETVRKLHALEKKFLQIDSAEITSYAVLQKEMENEARKLLHLEVDRRICAASAVYFCALVKDRFRCPGPFADDTIHPGACRRNPSSAAARAGRSRACVLARGSLYDQVQLRPSYPGALRHRLGRRGLDRRQVCRLTMYFSDRFLAEFPEMVNLVLYKSGSRLAIRSRPGYLGDMPVLYAGDPREMHSSGYDNVERIRPAADGSLTLDRKDPSSPHVLFTIVKGKGDFLYKKYVWVVREN